MVHTPVLHRPQNNFLPILGTNPRLEAPLPLYFSCTTFRNSVITLATPSIQKRTTRRWTLRCSHYKRVKATVVFVPCKDRDIVAQV